MGIVKPQTGPDWTKIVFKECHIQSAMCPSKSKINSSACLKLIYVRDGTLLICVDACSCATHKRCVEARSRARCAAMASENLASHIANVRVNPVETKVGSINIVVRIPTKRSTRVLLHLIFQYY